MFHPTWTDFSSSPAPTSDPTMTVPHPIILIRALMIQFFSGSSDSVFGPCEDARPRSLSPSVERETSFVLGHLLVSLLQPLEYGFDVAVQFSELAGKLDEVVLLAHLQPSDVFLMHIAVSSF